MLDMVRKHTIEGTGNHRTILSFLERTRDSIRQTRDVTRSFVPPPGLSKAVPIGSSSASMYPGYSPADIVYGDPARELGDEWAEAVQQGGGPTVLGPADGPQYELGQAKGLRKQKKSLAQIREEQAALGEPTALIPRDPPAAKAVKAATNGNVTNGVAGSAEAQTNGEGAPTANGDGPAFFIDTNPTPVKLPGVSAPPQTTKREQAESSAEEPRRKKAKVEEKNEEAEQVPAAGTKPKSEKEEKKAKKSKDIEPTAELATESKSEKKEKKSKKPKGVEAMAEPNAESKLEKKMKKSTKLDVRESQPEEAEEAKSKQKSSRSKRVEVPMDVAAEAAADAVTNVEAKASHEQGEDSGKGKKKKGKEAKKEA